MAVRSRTVRSPSRLNFAEMLRKADEVCDATGLSCYPAFLGTDNAAIAAYAGRQVSGL